MVHPAPPSLPNIDDTSPAAFWLTLAFTFAVLSLLVMWHRWGGTVEDSQAYFDTARYLRGEVPLSALRAPFPYRLAMPGLAALLPGDLRSAFATLNWLCTAGAALALARLVAAAGGNRHQAVLAGLLAIVAVPVFWYAPYLLTDPGAILGRSLFVLGIVTGQPWLALGAGLFATAVREENILLLGWLLVFGPADRLRSLAAIAMAGAWLLFVRWRLFPGLPSYTWVPNLGTVIAAVHDWKSLLTLFSAGMVMIPLTVLGWRHAPQRLWPLKGLLLLMALPPLYAALSVRIDGRVIWSLYPFMIPIAVFAPVFTRRGG